MTVSIAGDYARGVVLFIVEELLVTYNEPLRLFSGSIGTLRHVGSSARSSSR
jgi:hypothetical protein